MASKLTPRAKRLLVIAAATPFVCLLVLWAAPKFNSQSRNLAAVRQHIESIQPQWDEFAKADGFQFVELYAYTGGSGMFAASGYVPSEDHLAKLKAFMESTSPPRPVDLGAVQVLEPEAFEVMRKAKEAEQNTE